ncbi:response regulator [Parasegetibacter sp. MAH-26]|uniref:histidine kinase n=2 Tax=Pinibacter aurantiacus TaxID=2851599 RepID=A0A9E2S6Z4_9BACT|nr:response regulator [Pinibacter aurantiacus]
MDREGFMWFGTWNGINRFDGHKFVTFKSSPGDQSSLKNDRIDQITEDDFNHLWLKSYDGQIYRFDKRTQQFKALSAITNLPKGQHVYYSRILAIDQQKMWVGTEHNGLIMVTNISKDSSQSIGYNSQAAPANRLPANEINFFKIDTTGALWVATPKGLTRFIKNNSGIFEKSNSIANEISANIISVAEHGGSICFGAATGEIFLYDQSSKQINTIRVQGCVNSLLINHSNTFMYASTSSGKLFQMDMATQKINSYSAAGQSSLADLFEDRMGNLWIKPVLDGVLKFNTSNHQFKLFTHKNNGNEIYHLDHFRVFEDNQGTVWINMLRGGFGYYDPVTDQVEYFYDEPNGHDRRFSNIVSSVFYDPNGILWLRTDERGIEKITFQRNDFKQHLLINPGVFQTDNELRAMLQDRKGRLWIGAKSGKLYLYQNDKEIKLQFQNLPVKGIGVVYTIMQDRSGAMWLGTKTNGLYKAIPINAEETIFKLIHFDNDLKNALVINGNEIYSLLEDNTGRVWVGTFDNGLTVIKNSNDPKELKLDTNALAGYPSSRFRKVRHMAFDKDGNVWVGTTDGLLVINGKNTTRCSFRTYQKIPGDHSSLSNNNIQFIYRDSKNEMWLATSNGLSKAGGIHPDIDLKFDVYTMANGLLNDYLVSCVEDGQGNIWFATQAGLAKLDSTRKIFRVYNSFAGVPKYAFSEGSATRLNDGKIAFGTLKGYLTFDPKKILDHPINGGIAFTNLQINNRDITPAEHNSLLSYAVNYTDAITLKYNQNIISVDFAVPDFRWGSRPAFAYRLKGFDNDWQINNSDNRATYTNIPPGNYVFEVKCLSKGLYHDIAPKSMKIGILPPPWKTWWAYLIYSIVAFWGIMMIRRIGLTMLRLRQKIALEKKLSEIKLNFFTNVSHELRTPLTLIVNPIDEVLKSENLSHRGQQYMEVVQKNAERMSRFVDQLLMMRKLDSGNVKLTCSQIDLVAFIKDITTYFSEVANEKQITLRFHSDFDRKDAVIDLDKFETVIYNLLANAFKFTADRKVINVRILRTEKPEEVLIEVSDQGAGVPKEKIDKIFDLFYEYEGAGHQNKNGLGIGLALSKQLVELHNGTIHAKNNTNGGLTVKIMLPIVDHARLHQEKDLTITVAGPDVSADFENSKTGQFTDGDRPAAFESTTQILLVEDNADLQFFLKSQLADYFKVEVAKNGLEGLQKAKLLLPDLILSDIMMPEMDGLEMLSLLKKDSLTSHIPVILLTAKSAVESQIEGLNTGADYYITKPFSHDFLIAAIQNQIKKQQRVLQSLLENRKVVQIGPEDVAILPLDEQFLKKVASIVEDKMIESDFDIDTVAETLAMSRSSFYKKFKSLTGIAPVEFVREMRLKKSLYYFDAGYTNISEVAYMVGFNDPKYFGYCFKIKFEMTPKNYMKQIKETTANK